MTVLAIENIEKHVGSSVLFPNFSLAINQGEITAIFSSVNIRMILLEYLTGKLAIPNGEIKIMGNLLTNKYSGFEKIGFSFFNDGLYDRLTVMDHLTFFKRLYQSNQTFDQVLHITQLDKKKRVKVKHLTYSEQQRLQFARLLMQDPVLLIFEEPDLNVDMETKHVFLYLTKKLQQQGKSILVLTSNMESAITVADYVYRLDENGLRKIETDSNVGTNETEDLIDERENQTIQFNKIPTKVNDKMVLFDPPEIDYIESNDGVSHIYIKGEAFPCVFTLNDLEERLTHYGFFRCHRSYIVNLQKVREIITWTRNSYSLILDDKPKSSIPLSKAKMAQLKEMLGLK